MGTCTLEWYPDRGFELDLDLSDGELSLRLAAVPVPADGTVELEVGVSLDRIDILFKASVDLQGEPAQLQDARVMLVREGAATFLQLDARCEDVETGEVVPFQGRVPVDLPGAAPQAGGPRPVPANEDDLDWDDETTLEQLVVNGPESGAASGKLGREASAPSWEESAEPDRADPSGTPTNGGPARGARPKGLQALLVALSSVGDDDDEDEPSEEIPAGAAAVTRKGAATAPARNREDTDPGFDDDGDGDEPGDQKLGAEGEARALLDLLVDGENLEVEDDTDLDELASGVARILALPTSAERKAGRLSEWLLQQAGVADLYIGDDDLAEILEKW